jgi:hypothetical protein
MSRFKGKIWNTTLFTLFLLMSPLSLHAVQSMLIYGPTSGCYAETTPGFNITIWDTTQWAAATTPQFAAFNVIVFEDCPPGSDDATRWNTAIANESTWAPAVTGNTVILGTDPDNHYQQTVVQQLVTFAAADPSSRTGLYMALSRVYTTTTPNTVVPLLSGFGNFTVEAAGGVADNCVNSAHIIAVSPALSGVTDATLSNWTCSVHEGFDSWPSAFLPLVLALDANTKNYTAPDGTQGLVYMLGQGQEVHPIPSNTFTPTFTVTWTPTFTPTPSWTPTPCGYPGNTCTPTFTLTPTPTATFTPVCAPHVWPNPFIPRYAVNQVLKIDCLQQGCTVSFYTLAAELVATVPESDGIAQWNGKNSYGVPVSTGAYFYVIQQGKQVLQTGKLLVINSR